MRHIRRVSGGLSALCLVTGLGLVACDKDSSNATAPAASAPAATTSVAVTPPAPPPASTAETADDEAVNEELRDYHRHHHHGGVTMFISMAIDTLGLEPAKKAQVEKIQSDLHTKMAPARDAEHDLLSTIADGVAAGKIEPAKVDAAVAKVATASAGIHAATADALTQLHDALSPVERAAWSTRSRRTGRSGTRSTSRRRRAARRRGRGSRAHRASGAHARPGRQDQHGAEHRDAGHAADRSQGRGRVTFRPSRRHSWPTSSTRRRSRRRRPPRRVTSRGTGQGGSRASTRRSRRCSRRSSARSSPRTCASVSTTNMSRRASEGAMNRIIASLSKGFAIAPAVGALAPCLSPPHPRERSGPRRRPSTSRRRSRSTTRATRPTGTAATGSGATSTAGGGITIASRRFWRIAELTSHPGGRGSGGIADRSRVGRARGRRTRPLPLRVSRPHRSRSLARNKGVTAASYGQPVSPSRRRD